MKAYFLIFSFSLLAPLLLLGSLLERLGGKGIVGSLGTITDFSTPAGWLGKGWIVVTAEVSMRTMKRARKYGSLAHGKARDEGVRRKRNTIHESHRSTLESP